MATNLNIEKNLLEAAMRAGGHKTKKAAVTQALMEYIQKKNQAGIVELFGTVEFDESYDYKQARESEKKRVRSMIYDTT